MKEKTERVTIRLPQHLDKQILYIAQKHFNGDYSKATRFLCQLALIMYNRLDEQSIKDFV